MNSANYEVLGKMLKEFQIEQNEIEKKISENLLKIQEAQYYTNSFLEKKIMISRFFLQEMQRVFIKKN